VNSDQLKDLASNNTSSFPRRVFCARGLHLCFAHPERGVGGAPIRHPYILTSPQVAPGYFKGLDFFPCAALTPPLPSSRYIASNLDRALGSHARLEQAFRLLRTKRSPCGSLLRWRQPLPPGCQRRQKLGLPVSTSWPPARHGPGQRSFGLTRIGARAEGRLPRKARPQPRPDLGPHQPRACRPCPARRAHDVPALD